MVIAKLAPELVKRRILRTMLTDPCVPWSSVAWAFRLRVSANDFVKGLSSLPRGDRIDDVVSGLNNSLLRWYLYLM